MPANTTVTAEERARHWCRITPLLQWNAAWISRVLLAQGGAHALSKYLGRLYQSLYQLGSILGSCHIEANNSRLDVQERADFCCQGTPLRSGSSTRTAPRCSSAGRVAAVYLLCRQQRDNEGGHPALHKMQGRVIATLTDRSDSATECSSQVGNAPVECKPWQSPGHGVQGLSGRFRQKGTSNDLHAEPCGRLQQRMGRKSGSPTRPSPTDTTICRDCFRPAAGAGGIAAITKVLSQTCGQGKGAHKVPHTKGMLAVISSAGRGVIRGLSSKQCESSARLLS